MILGQPSTAPLSLTQLDDSQDPDYHPTFEDDMYETSDSEEEVVVRQDMTPSTTSTVRSPTKVTRSKVEPVNNKSKNIKHTVNQGNYLFMYSFIHLFQFSG
jgi:hypothetical protein